LEYGLRVAALPYQQPQGPHLTGLHPERTTVAAGEPLSVTAVLDRPAAALRLSVGQPPWLPGAAPVAYPTPPTLTVTVSLDTSYLPVGRAVVFTQAQSPQSVWGPAAARFITVTRTSAFRIAVSPPLQTAHAGDAAGFRVAITNTGAITAGFGLSVTADGLAVSAPVTATLIGPHDAARLDFSLTPTREKTGASAPATVTVCDENQAFDCIRATVAVTVEPRRVRLPIIALSREVGH
jgi:hypothetical protein